MKLRSNCLVNSALYIRVPSTVGNFFKSFVIKILLRVAGYFDIFLHLQQDASIRKACQ